MLTYAIITPARDEEEHLASLAESLTSQTVAPHCWVIVENGSRDGTAAVAHALSDALPWTQVVQLAAPEALARGGPIVRAFHVGLKHIHDPVDVVVKVDADLTLPDDHFELLLKAFDDDALLGIASGTCFDDAEGGRERFLTGDHVWGAARAYRWMCLRDVLPLEERMGWDGVDEFKAAARGWSTRVVDTTWFRHHRLEGARDDSRWAAWKAQGDVAWFMRYRPLYLLARTVYQAVREPAAVGIAAGYAQSALRGAPRLDDPELATIIRSQQRLRELPARAAEALGRH